MPVDHTQNTESHHDYPALECPICERLRKPHRLNKNGSVAYFCPPNTHRTDDYLKMHPNGYSWRITVDGALED